jgi:hypothetical protein
VERRIVERTAAARTALHSGTVSKDARTALDALAGAATDRHA